MNNYREKLEMSLKMRGLLIETEVVDFFYKNPNPVASEDFSMYYNYLKVNLEELHRDYYGKAIDQEIIKGCIKSIVKSYGTLSSIEIRYCMRAIVAGVYELNKYSFNTADLLSVLKRYRSKKNLVKSTYFEIKREDERAEEDKQAAYEFLQEALRKMDKGDYLTVYEKSAIGKHLADQLSDETLQAAREKTEQDLPQKIKELGKKRTAGDVYGVDSDMSIPMAWTFNLLYGVTLFELIKA